MRYTSLEQINWSNAQFIGSGQYQVVYRINKHTVVKVGYVNYELDIECLTYLADYKLAPKIYGTFYVHLSALPAFVRNDVHRDLAHHSGGNVRVTVMQYARPLLDFNAKDYDQHWNWCYSQVLVLREKVEQVGMDWEDFHTGNIGKIGNRLVVLDM